MAALRLGVQRREFGGGRHRRATALVHRHAARREGEPGLRRRCDHGRGERRDGRAADVASPGLGSHGHLPRVCGPVPARSRRDPVKAEASRVRCDCREEPDLLAAAGDDVHVDPARDDQSRGRDRSGLLDPGGLPIPSETAQCNGRGPENGPLDERRPRENRCEGSDCRRNRAGDEPLREGGPVPVHRDARGGPAVPAPGIPRADRSRRTGRGGRSTGEGGASPGTR